MPRTRRPAPKRSRAELLDAQLEAVLNDRDATLSPENAELSALLALAVDLRDLPRAEFRAALRQALRAPIAPRDLRAEARSLAPREDRLLGALDHASILLCRHSGLPPWERHPGGDELIVVLEGGGEITVLTEDGPVRSELRPGHVFVCPKGLWHRAHAQPQMTALYVTPLGGGEHSFAEDPRNA